MVKKMEYNSYTEGSKIYMACMTCGTYERVVIETTSVRCWKCILHITGFPEEPNRYVPTGRPPGWHFMKEFVDKDGNVFHKGKEQPELKGTLKPTKVKPRKKKKKLTADEKLYRDLNKWKKRKKAKRRAKK